jgi:hypothetical protein
VKRSTEIALVIAASLAFVACGRGPMSVEAPMIAADAQAPLAVGSSDGGRALGKTADAPFERGERFKGHYWCAQGRTELTLVIEDVVEHEVDLIFEFDFPGNARYPAAVGSYRMRGTWETSGRALKLKGERWIDQPGDYVMVDLAGTVSASGSISGRVTGAPQCTTFSVSPDRSKDGARRP